jgi:hypothetical protein
MRRHCNKSINGRAAKARPVTCYHALLPRGTHQTAWGCWFGVGGGSPIGGVSGIGGSRVGSGTVSGSFGAGGTGGSFGSGRWAWIVARLARAEWGNGIDGLLVMLRDRTSCNARAPLFAGPDDRTAGAPHDRTASPRSTP